MGHLEIIKFLIEKGIEVDALTISDYKTALHYGKL
jgi:hypothetical protein